MAGEAPLTRRLAFAVVIALGLVACGSASAWRPPAQAPASVRVPNFTHVVVVVFENHESAAIVGNPDAPTFNALSTQYASLTAYHGVTHPSLPNYLALVSGSTHGITNDCTSCIVKAKSLADSLDAAGKTWKTYAEDLPSAGYTGAFSGYYAKKHDPFLYFQNIASLRRRRAHVVPFTRLAGDLAAHRLPNFSLIVPNLCNDMHDCSVATGDAWLKAHIAPLVSSSQLRGGVVFVVFDEGTTDKGGGGHIDALALGPTVKARSVFAKATNHYGLLRTIEDAWHLPRLGLSARGAPIGGIWKGEGRARGIRPRDARLDLTRHRGARPPTRAWRARCGPRGAGRAAARLGS